MSVKDKTLAEVLFSYFCEDADEETKEYIFNHSDYYFDETFFEELEQHVGWKMRDMIENAEYHIRYIKEHINDTVTLDKESGMMYFNTCGVPAYWYHKGMSQKKIDENLQEYRRIWSLLGYPQVIQYPMMEYFRGMHEWQNEYRNNPEFFRKIERDLECLDTDEAKALHSELSSGRPLNGLQNVYPWKIKKILKVENFKEENDMKEADITLRLYDRSQCKVKVYTDKNGRYRGMTALGRRGFPWMAERDIKLIETEVFGKE